MTNGDPSILDCGDAAISIDFGDRIDPTLNARVLSLDEALRSLTILGVVETVPTYRSLMIHLDPCRVDREALVAKVRELAKLPAKHEVARLKWEVPVVYGGEFGEDLSTISAHAGLAPRDFIEAHAAAVYRVYMIGFMPGFSYLGGMDQRLAMPRRGEPRPRVPASSVSIGGGHTAIGTVESPSGWHLIGRTPARAFMPMRKPQFLFSPGDEIVFRAISPSRWASLDAAAAAGDPVARMVA